MSAAAPALILVNDRPHPLAAGATVAALLRELAQAERRGVAVAVNGAVVARAHWAERPLAAGDRVLVIQATQGG
jgi:sulfur carrier protein